MDQESGTLLGRNLKKFVRDSQKRPRRIRLANRPLGVQFLIAGGIVGVFSVVSIFVLLSQVGRQTEASRWLARTHRIIARLNTLGRDFYRQQSALREFVETANRENLSLVRERRSTWQADHAALLEMVRGHESAASDSGEGRLREIERHYGIWSSYADELADIVEQGRKPDEAMLREEAARFQQAFLLIDSLINDQNRQLAVRDLDEKRAVQQTFALIAVINILLLLIFSFVLVNLYHAIARPIANLSTGIRRYMTGDFRARVPVSNRSEIGYLEASFNDLAERIEVMVADLRHLDEMKTDFLSTVSHELRTPLTSIGGYIKLLLSGDAGEVTPTQKEFLFIVDTNVVRLTNLINDLLDVEKIESGKIQLVREPQDLVSVLKECRDTFEILARQKGLELRYDVPDEAVFTIGDRSRLVQIFMNLISNAIKYTEKGHVGLSLEQKDYAILVRVSDTGVGLAPEEQEKLFQKFYRTRSALSSTEGGTGLGLVIVRGLVEAHGGTITVESRPGGTIFTVSLPVEDVASVLVEDLREVSSSQAMPATGPAEAWRKTIWLVDSSADDVEKIRAMVEESSALVQGHSLKVERFTSTGALPRIRDRWDAPVLVIVDAETVGGELGISVVREKARSTVPVLVIGSSVDTVKAFSEGASAILTKPIRQARLLNAIRNLVSARGWKVLVADPNTDMRLLLKRSLEQRGIRVDDVDRGNLLLSALERDSYDVVLMDLGFPDVHGTEVLKVVRRMPQYSGLSIFVMTEEKEPVERRELGALGVDRFVAKYKGIDSVVDTLCQFLEEQRERETAPEESPSKR